MTDKQRPELADREGFDALTPDERWETYSKLALLLAQEMGTGVKNHHFVTVAYETLTSSSFHRIAEEAKRRAKANMEAMKSG